jgi:hypothetical protein
MHFYTKNRFLQRVYGRLVSKQGKKTNAKIVIIESDDWGMQRAMDEEALTHVEKKYGAANFTRWTTDALETTEDIDLLCNLLADYAQSFQSQPVITANFITHNIDYASTDTCQFKSIATHHTQLKSKYQSAITNGHLYAELHGYSHFQHNQLLHYFASANGKADFANRFFFAKTTIKNQLLFLRGEFAKTNSFAKENLLQAVQVFKNVFGYSPKTLIAPNFIFDEIFFDTIKNQSIHTLQSANRCVNAKDAKLIVAPFGFTENLFFSARNCRLDPHPNYNFFADQCIAAIEKCFAAHVPAVIDCHRVNFSGRFTPAYRNTSINELKKVLDHLAAKHPDTLFLNSAQLKEQLWHTQTN